MKLRGSRRVLRTFRVLTHSLNVTNSRTLNLLKCGNLELFSRFFKKIKVQVVNKNSESMRTK